MPKFIIIGAQKAGTSALAAYLGRHPQLQIPRHKEIDYFGSNRNYSRGARWYEDQLNASQARGKKFLYEASPHYLLAPETAARIAKDSPHARLIVLLREPVGRAHSAWSMYRKFLSREPDFFQRWNRRCFTDEEIARFVPRSAEETEDMHLAVEHEIDCLQRGQRPEWSVVEYGLYGPQLQHYRKYFPAQNFLILNAKNLYDQAPQTLAHVCRELDLDDYPWHEQDFKRVHVGDYSTTPQMLPRTRELLENFYAESNRTLASEWSLDAEWLYRR